MLQPYEQILSDIYIDSNNSLKKFKYIITNGNVQNTASFAHNDRLDLVF